MDNSYLNPALMVLVQEVERCCAELNLFNSLRITLRRNEYYIYKSRQSATVYRLYGARWNERRCQVGKVVIITNSNKQHMIAEIIGFQKEKLETSNGKPFFEMKYGKNHKPSTIVAEITLSVIEQQTPRERGSSHEKRFD